jgi:hypothetical protein
MEAFIADGGNQRKQASTIRDATCVRERAVEAPEHVQNNSTDSKNAVEKSLTIKSTSLRTGRI